MQSYQKINSYGHNKLALEKTAMAHLLAVQEKALSVLHEHDRLNNLALGERGYFLP